MNSEILKRDLATAIKGWRLIIEEFESHIIYHLQLEFISFLLTLVAKLKVIKIGDKKYYFPFD